MRRTVGNTFPRLGADQVAGIAAQTTIESFTTGETVFREGTYANGFYIVISGRAEICQMDDGGNDVLVRTLGPGDFFGEIGLLTQPRRTATVRAKTPLEIAALDRDEFFALMQSSLPTAAFLSAVGRKRAAREPQKASSGRTGSSTRKKAKGASR